MALILRCLIGCRNQCNTKKLGFFGSHLTKHHHHHHHRHLIPSSLSFSTTTTGTTTLPAEGSPDEHHRKGGIRTSIINERPADDSTKTNLPEDEHCVETLTLGGGLGDVGGATEKQRDAEINSCLISLGQFAAFSISEEQFGMKMKIEFVRVVSAKAQLVRNGRLYYITIEALDSGVQKLYEAHVLDTRTQSNSISLKEWCEIKVPMSSTKYFFDSSQKDQEVVDCQQVDQLVKEMSHLLQVLHHCKWLPTPTRPETRVSSLPFTLCPHY